MRFRRFLIDDYLGTDSGLIHTSFFRERYTSMETEGMAVIKHQIRLRESLKKPGDPAVYAAIILLSRSGLVGLSEAATLMSRYEDLMGQLPRESRSLWSRQK